MKKGLALILTLAVVAMLVPVGIVSLTASAAVENSYADIVNIYRDSISGSTTPSSDSKILSCEVVDGKITVKVQLAQWDYIQFAQPVTDIIHSYDVADYDTLQVNLGEHDIGETLPNPNGDTTNTYWDAYRNAHFFVSLTDNPDYTVRAVDAYWQIKGGSMFSGNTAGWENAVFAAAGRLPGYPLTGSVGYFSRNGSQSFQTRGVAFPFNFETDKDGYLMMDSVNDVANKFCNVGANEAEKKANYDKHVTVKDLNDVHHSHGNGTDAECYNYSYQPAANTAVYPRITSVRPGVNVYSICLNSKDIDGPIDPSKYVNIHRDSISGSTTPSSDSKILNCKVEDGKITVKVQLAQWDYIQFAQPVTDIIHSYDVADYDTLQVNLGEHDIGETLPAPSSQSDSYWTDYRQAHFFVSLTDNPDYTVRAVDAYWQIKGGSMFSGNAAGWENAVFAAAGRLPAYPLTGSVGYFSRNGSSSFQTRGVAFPFNFETDKDGYLMMDSVNDVANKFCNVGANEAEKKANYDKHVTVKDLDDMFHSHGNGTDIECYDYSYQPAANTALYPRITSVRPGVNVYSICLNSADIKLDDAEPEIEVEDVEIADGDEFVNDTRGFGVLGSQVRTTDNSLRFVARISQALIDQLSEDGGEVKEYGIALVSENYFGANGGGNGKTALELDGSNTTAVNKNTVAKVKAEKIYKDFEDYNNYTAVITGLKSEKQMSTRFCARAYVIYTDAEGVEHIYYATEDDNDAGAGNYKTGYGAYWKSLNQAKADLSDAN